MASVNCPGCGGSHWYTATGLAAVLAAALEGEMHVVGMVTNGKGEDVVQVKPRCLLLSGIPASIRRGQQPTWKMRAA